MLIWRQTTNKRESTNWLIFHLSMIQYDELWCRNTACVCFVDSSYCKDTLCMFAIFLNLNEHCLLSSLAVGKTSLITRFMYDSFDNTYQVMYMSCPKCESWKMKTFVDRFSLLLINQLSFWKMRNQCCWRNPLELNVSFKYLFVLFFICAQVILSDTADGAQRHWAQKKR